MFHMYYNGTCKTEQGVVIKQEGCTKPDVMAYYKANKYFKRTIYKKNYIIYYNGKVTTEDGEVILEKGGYTALLA